MWPKSLPETLNLWLTCAAIKPFPCSFHLCITVTNPTLVPTESKWRSQNKWATEFASDCLASANSVHTCTFAWCIHSQPHHWLKQDWFLQQHMQPELHLQVSTLLSAGSSLHHGHDNQQDRLYKSTKQFFSTTFSTHAENIRTFALEARQTRGSAEKETHFPN